MANEQHLKVLKQGVDAWNKWRRENPSIEVNLEGASLGGGNLEDADLEDADLEGAYLEGANLTGAKLIAIKLERANVVAVDFEDANLERANLEGANLTRANLPEAWLNETILNNVDLSTTKGLNDCRHMGPSGIDYRTIARSKNVPISFWRGCGLSDWQIEAAKLSQPGLTQDDVISITYEVARVRGEQPIQLFSPFISYSSKDDAFARCFYDGLQERGVRCWYAPEDMKIGDRVRSRIDEVIHVHDKLLLVLSEHSLVSQWVEQEVETALAKERETGESVLFPIKVDNAVDELKHGWPALVRNTRHIGDFSNWEDDGAFEAALNRVLRDLRAMQ